MSYSYNIMSPLSRVRAVSQNPWIFRYLFLLAVIGTSQAKRGPYEECHDTFRRIINGSLTLDWINNATIWDSGLLYTGTLYRLSKAFRREDVLTPTILGKPHF